MKLPTCMVPDWLIRSTPATGKTYKESSGWQPIEPGDACWEDINGDNIINGYDRSVMGNIFPNVTVVSLLHSDIKVCHSMPVSTMLWDTPYTMT